MIGNGIIGNGSKIHEVYSGNTKLDLCFSIRHVSLIVQEDFLETTLTWWEYPHRAVFIGAKKRG